MISQAGVWDFVREREFSSLWKKIILLHLV